MDIATLNKMIAPRKHAKIIEEQVKDAVCLHAGGRHVEEYIRSYSDQEDPLKLGHRRQIASKGFENYIERVVNQLIEGVFGASNVERVSGIPQLDEYLRTEYSDYAQKEIYPPLLYLCELFIQVGLNDDDPILNDEDAGRDEVIAAGIQYVPRPIFPHHVINFEEKFNGELKWISLKYQDDDSQIEIITPNEIVIYDRKSEEMQSNPNPLGFVPVMRFYDKVEHACDGKVGRAMLQEVIDKTLYGLQWLAMLAEAGWLHLNLKMIAGPDTAQLIKKAGLSNSKVIVESADKENYVETRYLEIPTAEMDILDKINYERIPDSVMLAARLRDRTTDKSLSGFAKWLDSKPEFGMLKYVSTFFKRVDIGIIGMLMRCYKRTPNKQAPSKVVYPSAFDVKNTSEIIADLATASQATIIQSATGNGEIAKSYYRASLPNADIGIIKSIEGEIDDEVRELLSTEDEDPGAPDALQDAQEPVQHEQGKLPSAPKPSDTYKPHSGH